jgi:hypothetical protein
MRELVEYKKNGAKIKRRLTDWRREKDEEKGRGKDLRKGRK